MAEQGHSSGPTDAKSASTAFPGPRPKESEGKDIIPDPLGIKSTFSFGTMTHCQQSWQIPEFSSLGCWKHWHGPNSSICLSDTVYIVIMSSYIPATQSELRFPSLDINRAKSRALPTS
ncbi:hypothetical protein M419DRAFT_38618 [Trichoderma reesei RUT C-30]|uniref:Uncharacterized protein n=1 Tax=Hypocrea jecorina (strain ATCC 56765 / BCRC 32924 / NRRL 11460 / Rut C-30) TaxID=1344414 RepID=A0A024S1P5_HYPJR|nr:hypothetical protein M419DRAFT_38618 [Trichoderma reesei RUT C-30]